MAVSIADVAARAGVSRTTVSQVLIGGPNHRISEATQERVRQAMKELDYQPNGMARGLRSGRTFTVGLLVNSMRNPFFVHVAEITERLLEEAGYHMILDATFSANTASSRESKLKGWSVDGILHYHYCRVDRIEALGKSGARQRPIVFLGEKDMTTPQQHDVVVFDLYGGARRLAEHLIEKGYRRIAQIIPGEHRLLGTLATEPRYRAYTEACEAAGVQLETLFVDGDNAAMGRELGLALGQRSAKKRPEAVLCFNDSIAIGVYYGLRRCGLKVPGDIAVAGFDGIEESQILDCPLTTVNLPVEELCRQAVAVLLERMAAKYDGKESSESAPVAHIVVPTELRVGEST
jgi:DNA-binding LacI/PurR family transcriptional regulator